MSQYELKSFSENGVMGEPRSGGIRIKAVTGLVLVFLAIVAAVGVGLIVHFAENRTLECSFPDTVVTNGQGNTQQQQLQVTVKQTTARQQTTHKSVTEKPPTATPPDMTTAAPSVRNIRLPGGFAPSRYTLKLKPDFYSDDPSTFSFDGKVEIVMKSLAPSTNVTLHARDLTIKAYTVKFGLTSGAGNSPRFTSISTDEERDFLIIHLDQETTIGNEYTLSMQFSGPLKDDLRGLYYSSYKRGNQTVYIATTQFEVLDARKAFPCFDEPAMKATFKVTLVRKRHLVSLSNMPLATTISRADDFVEDVYMTTKRMSTYLLAFIIGEFGNTTMRVPGTNITYGAWARPELVNQTRFALQVGAHSTANYNNFFNVKFPLPKQDMIALPDFRVGAMENWGLVTYGERSMLYEEGVTSAKQKQDIAITITHELGHQWFGDLVTLEWWDDVWLNEGFATFVENIAVDMLYPEWKRFDQFVVSILHTALEFDSYVTSHPLYSPIAVRADIYFDDVAYKKGASVIRMVRFMIGDGTFQRSLHRYLKEYAYENANHNDLWAAFSQQCAAEKKPLDIPAIMAPWTVQMNYPVVKVVKKDGKLAVSQTRFLKNQTALTSASFQYQWQIPFTFVTESFPDFDVTDRNIIWVTDMNQEISAPSVKPTDWLIANVRQYGFYRVNYEDDNWLALIQQLKTNHQVIHTTNRAQIINDAWSLSRAGLLSTSIALQTLEYLDKELDFVPWMAAWKQITYLDTMLRQTEHYGKFQTLLASKLRAPFKHYGMSGKNSTHLDSLSRWVITELACTFGLRECLQESTKLFDMWMSNPEVNPIDPNVRQAVYCTAVAEGDASHWEFIYQQLLEERSVTERVRLMTSLACTRTTWLISRYLKLSITPTVIRKQDAVTVMNSIAKTPLGQLLVWDFIRENWDYLYNEYGKGALDFSGLITVSLSSFSSKFHLEQMRNFQDKHPDLGRHTVYLQRAIEEVMSNIDWITNNVDTVADWLTVVSSTKPTVRLTDVRLPRHLLPRMYDVTLKPLMYSGDPATFTYEGHVKIYTTAKAAGSNVTIHVNNIDILDDTVIFQTEDGSDGPSYVGGSMEVDEGKQFRIFHLDNTVAIGNSYTLEMNFTARLTNGLVGLYYSQYKRGNDTIYIAATHFEPTDARRAFPCFDEPQMKAEFNVKLVRKSHMVSVSNMPVVETQQIEDDFMVDVYQKSRKMSTYLLAFIVCDFIPVEGKTIRNTTFRAWARPESINQTAVALDAGIKVLSHYEDFFGVPFPLPKQGMIAIPDYVSGAMEHWGIITYRETSMLYQPGVSAANNLQRVNHVVAHELAHMWFGDLVTMEWWDDLWLNEGFARFVEYIGIDFVNPTFKIFDQFIMDLHPMFDIDSLVTSHPIFVPVQNPDEIHEIFDKISYNKGASVIRMMRFFLGHETFRKGVQKYLKAKKYSNADHDDLWAGLQQQADEDKKSIDVRSIMDTWIKQMNYPVVMVNKSATGKIQVKQNRFISNTDAKDPGKFVSPFGYKWKIPFTVTTEINPRFNQTDNDVVWINKDAVELQDTYPANHWLIGNIQQLGVYRVNYDDSNWNLLIQQLIKDHTIIHDVNRAQIINDAFGLAKASQLSMDIALRTLDYLDEEQGYVPWYAAGVELDYIETMLAETEAYGTFQRFIKKKVEKQFARLGLKDNGTDHLQSLLRSTIAAYACSSGNQQCIKEAKTLFQQFKSKPDENPISPGLKTTVYCTVIAEGGEEEWQFVFNKYMSETVQTEKARLLHALACTREIWILNKFLHMFMDSSIIRKQDAPTMFGYVAATPVGKYVAWDFFRANFDEILRVYGSLSFAMTRIVEGITPSFNSEYSLQQLKDFQKLHPDMGAGTRAFSQAIEKTAANVKWMDTYYNVVEEWLAKN